MSGRLVCRECGRNRYEIDAPCDCGHRPVDVAAMERAIAKFETEGRRCLECDEPGIFDDSSHCDRCNALLSHEHGCCCDYCVDRMIAAAGDPTFGDEA